ncbi:hypothetical protein V4U86_02095 [Mycobacterium sp. AMU20-3851]|uniref:hypothetical protein n=1 Tax=Mycobacterium sp. AMU20-3851 TaxID=3122055 RepID=UPI0037544717
MISSDSRPSTVAPCRHCDTETVWLQTVYGGWLLFDATEFPTEDSAAGNRFAIQRRSRRVVDLDDVYQSRWPATCLHLHRFECPSSHDDRFHQRRPRQSNEIDLEDLFQRLAERRNAQRRAG